MNKTSNLFLSWSGPRSKWVAESLRDWLPMVVQSTRPWMSDRDIEKGTRGLNEVTRALDGIRVGVVCLTPENLHEDWILYESGALSKSIDEKARLCTYLLGGLEWQHVKGPLGMFQATKADKEETRRMVQTINKAVSEEALSDDILNGAFEAMWPRLKERLDNLPKPKEEADPKRSTEDMVEEILELTRAAANSRKQVEPLDQYVPMFKELMPMLAKAIEVSKRQPNNVVLPPPPGPSIPPSPQEGTYMTFYVKAKGVDNPLVFQATHAKELASGTLLLYYRDRVVGKVDNAEQWWTA